MKKVIVALIFSILGYHFHPVTIELYKQYTATDEERIVMLLDYDGGHCTGFNIQAPSGKLYIMTAAHCSSLVTPNGVIHVKRPGMAVTSARIIKTQPEIDLMLLEYTGGPYFKLAERDSEELEDIHTWGYGRRSPAWLSDGYIRKKNTIIRTSTALMVVDHTSVKVDFGSSGGPMIDVNHNIIGVVIVMDGGQNAGIVPIESVRLFLKGL